MKASAHDFVTMRLSLDYLLSTGSKTNE